MAEAMKSLFATEAWDEESGRDAPRAREELLPVHLLPGGGTTGSLPEPHVLGVGEDIAHSEVY